MTLKLYALTPPSSALPFKWVPSASRMETPGPAILSTSITGGCVPSAVSICLFMGRKPPAPPVCIQLCCFIFCVFKVMCVDHSAHCSQLLKPVKGLALLTLLVFFSRLPPVPSLSQPLMFE